eukprot:GFYU01020878.1.p2 GENE.GFYU01020878.1~~GFYU01020878.1.p2  ORF type:complete len:136 (+),score=6.90 GFYU01020878.1:315-722(+)
MNLLLCPARTILSPVSFFVVTLLVLEEVPLLPLLLQLHRPSLPPPTDTIPTTPVAIVFQVAPPRTMESFLGLSQLVEVMTRTVYQAKPLPNKKREKMESTMMVMPPLSGAYPMRPSMLWRHSYSECVPLCLRLVG